MPPTSNDTASKPSKKTTSDKPAISNLQSLERAITLLQATAYSEAGLRLTELADHAGLSKSTTHRILSWLVEHNLLRLAQQGRIYTPGSALYRLGQAAARHFSLVDIARPSLQRLADATEDTVYLSVIDGDEAVCVERVIGAYPIKTLTLAPGDRRPLGVGAGALALLAALPRPQAQLIVDDDSHRAPKYANFTIEWLGRLVAETRRKGYSFNAERVLKGMSAVGMAVSDPDGRPICAISVAAISSRMTPGRRTTIVAQLQQECAVLSNLASNLRSGESL